MSQSTKLLCDVCGKRCDPGGYKEGYRQLVHGSHDRAIDGLSLFYLADEAGRDGFGDPFDSRQVDLDDLDLCTRCMDRVLAALGVKKRKFPKGRLARKMTA